MEINGKLAGNAMTVHYLFFSTEVSVNAKIQWVVKKFGKKSVKN